MRPVIVVVAPLGPAFRWALAQLLPQLQRKTMLTAFERFFDRSPETLAASERRRTLDRQRYAREQIFYRWEKALTEPVHLLHRRDHPLMRELFAKLQREIVVKKGRVQGTLLPGSLEWVVPCPPGEITLERVVKQIAGQADFRKSYSHVTPSQGSEAIGMLQGGWPLDLVQTALRTLQAWGWFREAGLLAHDPWEVTEEHWAALRRSAPWREHEEREEKRRQKAEAKARKPVQGVLF